MNIKLLIFLFYFILTLSYCSSQNEKTIKIGILFPLTGELADKGLDSVRGTQLAVDEINSSGGIKSLNGAMLQQVIGDTKGNPEHGAIETERLILKDGVSAIIGTYQSSVTKQTTQVAEKLLTPFIVSISLADIITERGFRYTFRVQPKAEFYCRDQIEFLKDLKKMTGYSVRRVALIHENSDFGTSTAYAQKKILKDQNFSIAADVSYDASVLNTITKEITALLASKPDAILSVTYLNDSIVIAKTLARMNSKIPLIDTAGGSVSAEFISLAGTSSENIFSSAEFSKYTEKGRSLNERFHSKYGTDMTGDSAYAYQSVFVLRNAIERAGSTDRDRIRDALASTDMTKSSEIVIPASRIKFNQHGQNEAARLYIVQIQKGEYLPVWPEEYAKAKIRMK